MATDFQDMISNFGSTVTVKRRAAGTYTNGRWVEGTESELSVVASIQPARGSHLAFLPEAQRTGEELIGYFASEIFTSRAQPKKNSDVIIWQGKRYVVLSVRRWLPTQIYWEAILTREVEE
jgi:hypothetical protein